jgi:uncharacterized membrane protein
VSRYDLLVFLHVASAIIWLGAAFVMGALQLKASRSGDPAELGRIGADEEWLAPRLFIPAALATLLFGILLVADSPTWTFGALWIQLGLAGFVLNFVTGIGFLKPEGERLKAAVERHGPTSPEVARHGYRLALVSRLELVLLFAVVAVMAAKPASGDTGTLAGLGAGVVLAWIAIGALSRRKAAPAPDAPRVVGE